MSVARLSSGGARRDAYLLHSMSTCILSSPEERRRTESLGGCESHQLCTETERARAGGEVINIPSSQWEAEDGGGGDRGRRDTGTACVKLGWGRAGSILWAGRTSGG